MSYIYKVVKLNDENGEESVDFFCSEELANIFLKKQILGTRTLLIKGDVPKCGRVKWTTIERYLRMESNIIGNYTLSGEVLEFKNLATNVLEHKRLFFVKNLGGIDRISWYSYVLKRVKILGDAIGENIFLFKKVMPSSYSKFNEEIAFTEKKSVNQFLTEYEKFLINSCDKNLTREFLKKNIGVEKEGLRVMKLPELKKGPNDSIFRGYVVWLKSITTEELYRRVYRCNSETKELEYTQIGAKKYKVMKAVC